MINPSMISRSTKYRQIESRAQLNKGRTDQRETEDPGDSATSQVSSVSVKTEAGRLRDDGVGAKREWPKLQHLYGGYVIVLNRNLGYKKLAARLLSQRKWAMSLRVVFAC